MKRSLGGGANSRGDRGDFIVAKAARGKDTQSGEVPRGKTTTRSRHFMIMTYFMNCWVSFQFCSANHHRNANGKERFSAWPSRSGSQVVKVSSGRVPTNDTIEGLLLSAASP